MGCEWEMHLTNFQRHPDDEENDAHQMCESDKSSSHATLPGDVSGLSTVAKSTGKLD